jgi:RimJ/RimL family protein N-acetyltransferase
MKTPTLETPRLILREYRPGDFEDYARMWADPVMCRHVGGQVRTRGESWMRFLRHFGMWHVVGYGYWAIEEKASGHFLGESGFQDAKRETVPPLGDSPEAGWALAPHAQGRGFATEAVMAVVAWGDRHLRGRKQICIIEPSNRPSLKVAEKCGFKPAGSVLKEGVEIGLFERTKAQ